MVEVSSPSMRIGGDRESLSVDQAIHGCDDLEGLRAPVLLFRVRVSAVLALAGGGCARAGRSDGGIQAITTRDGG